MDRGRSRVYSNETRDFHVSVTCTIPISGPQLAPMIVCSCNVISDHDVRGTLAGNAGAPQSAGEVFGCLGCSPQCGRCARTIRRIMDEALTAADRRSGDNF
jgi:bacterioferritin-associated ferredoxin